MSGTSEAGTISLDVAAKLLMLTPQRVNQLVREGFIPKASHGRYTVVGVVQGYIRFLKDEERRTSKSSADSRLKDIKAKREELRLARDERELILLADALFAIDEVAGAVALEVNNVPARFTRDLDERERLQAEIDDALHKVADRVARSAAALTSGRDADPPEDEDDA